MGTFLDRAGPHLHRRTRTRRPHRPARRRRMSRLDTVSLHEPWRGNPVVVIAPDSFKGSLEAVDVAAAIAGGFHDVVGTEAALLERPMADGGRSEEHTSELQSRG